MLGLLLYYSHCNVLSLRWLSWCVDAICGVTYIKSPPLLPLKGRIFLLLQMFLPVTNWEKVSLFCSVVVVVGATIDLLAVLHTPGLSLSLFLVTNYWTNSSRSIKCSFYLLMLLLLLLSFLWCYFNHLQHNKRRLLPSQTLSSEYVEVPFPKWTH